MKLLVILVILGASAYGGWFFEQRWSNRSGYLFVILMMAISLFLFAGLPLLIFEENTDGVSDKVLLELSLMNQSCTALFLLMNRHKQVGHWSSRYFLYSCGIGFGALLFSTLWMWLLEFLGMTPEPQDLVSLLDSSNPIMLAMVLTLITLLAPISEELLFRDTLQQVLKQGMDTKMAVVITGMLFGLMHFDSWAAIFPLMIFGIGLGWLRESSKSVFYSMVAHFINNIVVVLALRFF